jgi:beta-glucosidase
MNATESPNLPSVSTLSIEEKISLLSGADFWRSRALPGRGVPSVKLSDGPNGVRGDLSRSIPATCFPVGVCLGASWNPGLLAEVARALAGEAREKSAHVVLGPTINLQRTPIGGRNFECYSEDPYLTGILGTAFVASLQAEGIGACPKHFVANDTEFERHTISSVVDQETLEAVYLLPFEMIVRRARPWMIMSSYNRVNGTYASSHTELLVTTLKDKWGFDGVVVSDWGAALETIPNALGGLDLEMPGPSKVWGKKLVAAVEEGNVSEAIIDEKIERLFRLIERTKACAGQAEQPETGIDAPEKRDLLKRAAQEGMVLLKNSEKTLPLEPGFKGRIAVIGPNAARGQIMGGGSSYVNSHRPSHPLEGIKAAFPNATVEYLQGCRNNKYAPLIDPLRIRHPSGLQTGFEKRTYATSRFDGQPTSIDRIPSSVMKLLDADGAGTNETAGIILEGDYTPETGGSHVLGLMSAGRARLFVDSEEVIDNWTDWRRGFSFYTFGSDEIRANFEFEAGRSYRLRIEYERPSAALIAGVQFGIEPPLSDTAIPEAAHLAGNSDVTFLILGSNPDWETEGNDREVHSLPGSQNELAEAVLNASPRTIVVMNVGSATEMPWFEKADAVLVTWFGGQEMGNALGDVVCGRADPGGRLPFTWPKHVSDHPAMKTYPGRDGEMPYTEGPCIGYRGFNAQDVQPLAPFGFGLSYGDAEIGAANWRHDAGSDARVAQVEIVSRSNRASTVVVQAYAETIARPGSKPFRALVGIAKLVLRSGETQTLDLPLDYAPIRRLVAGSSPADMPIRVLIGTSAEGPFSTLD